MNFFEFMAKNMISKTSKRSNSQVSEYEMSDLAVCEGRWELVGKNEKCWYTIVSSQLFSTLFTSISGKEWMTGKRLFDYIRKQTLPDGTTFVFLNLKNCPYSNITTAFLNSFYNNFRKRMDDWQAFVWLHS